MHTPMPEQGRDSGEVLEQLEAFKQNDPTTRRARSGAWSTTWTSSTPTF